MDGLISLTHGAMRQPAELAQFFWQHLELDISILGKAVGKSEDDVCLLLHLILRNMATNEPGQCMYLLAFLFYFMLTILISLLFCSHMFSKQ